MEIKILEYLTLIFGLYMAWNIGANDVANAISTSVGSKAIPLKYALILAGLLEFFGAYFLGGRVSKRLQSGIVKPEIFADNYLIFVLGMLAALLSTSIWLNLASLFKLPVSTTHAIVGSVLGFGAIIGGLKAVNWPLVSYIAMSWIITPLISGVIAYLMFLWIQKKILFALSPVESTKKILPLLVFFSIFIFIFSFLTSHNGVLKINISFFLAFLYSSIIASIFSIISFLFVNRFKVNYCKINYYNPHHLKYFEKTKKQLLKINQSSKADVFTKTKKMINEMDDIIDTIHEKTKVTENNFEYFKIEKAFGFLQILSLCLVAFAHGTNDVANAIGPVAAIIRTLSLRSINFSATIPSWIILIGSIGIVFGLATWGWRVVETIGHNITTLTPTRGFSAEFGAATTILIASKLGLPISTTHALVGAVLGVGLAKGISALNLKTLKDIVLSWIITVPICAVSSIAVFYILKKIFI